MNKVVFLLKHDTSKIHIIESRKEVWGKNYGHNNRF